MPTNYSTDQTREEWLIAVAERIGADLLAPNGMTLPRYRVTCGFPCKSAGSRTRQRIGECHPPTSSADETTEVIVSPVIADPIDAAAVLAHELVHAAVGCEHKHDRTFAAAVHAIGLEGKPTATTPGDEFRSWAERTLDVIGPYPHAILSLDTGKRQTTRMLKLSCPVHPDYILRATRKQIERGAPFCGICREQMTPEGSDDA